MTFVTLYFILGSLMGICILTKQPIAGSKSDYAHLKAKIEDTACGSAKAEFWLKAWVVLLGVVFWPIILWARYRDLNNGGQW